MRLARGEKRIRTENGIEMCYCSSSYHADWLPCTEFNINNHSKNGFQYLCKKCHLFQRRGIDETIPDDKAAKLILERLGYDFESPESIHKQFMKRHGL